jgi:hypothetical protein
MRRVEPVLPRRIFLLAGGGQERIAAQLVVVIEIFVAQGQAIQPLGQQLRQGVIHKMGIAPIGEAARQPAREAQLLIHLAEEQHAAIAGEGAAGKIRHDLARPQVLKEQGLALTFCRRRSGECRVHRAQCFQAF